MHSFKLVILLCLAPKGLILFTLLSILHLPLWIRIYSKNRQFKQNNGYEDALSCPWMDFFLLFSFGTLLWNMIFVQEEIGQTLSLSEASLRLSSNFIDKSVWGIGIYLWNECLIFYSHLVFLQQFMSLWNYCLLQVLCCLLLLFRINLNIIINFFFNIIIIYIT